MTIEEAIRHCDDVAEKKSQFCDDFEKSCGKEHEQLAKWLEELKVLREENAELKRLLNFALEDFGYIYREHICTSELGCLLDCPYCDEEDCCKGKWKHADEALKLIGGDKND